MRGRAPGRQKDPPLYNRLLSFSLVLTFAGVVAACGSSGSTPATTTVSAPSPATETVPTPVVAGLPVTKWRILAPKPLPAGVTLYLEKGCYQCDGPAESIERASASSGGTTAVASLFKLGGPSADGRYIHSSYIAPDGHEMWVTVCSRGYCGGVANPSADAQVTFYHSIDEGVTWPNETMREGVATVAAVTAIGPFVLTYCAAPDDCALPTPYSIHANGPAAPASQLVTAPAEARGLVYPQTGTSLIWWGKDLRSFLRSDGSTIYRADPAIIDSAGSQVSMAGAPSADGRTFAVDWSLLKGSVTTAYQGLIRDGKLTAIFSGFDRGALPRVGAWVNETTAYGNIFVEASAIPGMAAKNPQAKYNLPCVIDYKSGTITPLELYGPLFSDAYGGRNLVRAATAMP